MSNDYSISLPDLFYSLVEGFKGESKEEILDYLHTYMEDITELITNKDVKFVSRTQFSEARIQTNNKILKEKLKTYECKFYR